MSDLADRLVRAESLDAIEAAIRKYNKSGQAAGLYTVHRHVQRYAGDIAELTGCLTTWLSEVEDQNMPAADGEPAADTLRVSIAILLLQLATIRDFFAVPRTSDEWTVTFAQDWLGGLRARARCRPAGF